MHGGYPPATPRPEKDGGTSASALGLLWGRPCVGKTKYTGDDAAESPHVKRVGSRLR